MVAKNSYENHLSVRQMFSKNLFLLFFFFVAVQQVNAQRVMYVSLRDPSGDIIVDNSTNVPVAQTKLLEYARDNNVTYLTLYGLNDILNVLNLDAGLNNFIDNAKNNYCIKTIAANINLGGLIGYPTGTNTIAAYNSNPLYPFKIDALISEYEFWKDEYYGTFETVYLPMLDRMNDMKENSGSVFAVTGIKQVDVYLNGKEPGTSNQIFSTSELDTSSLFNLSQTEMNTNKVDNRADNIFITCYKYYDSADNFYDAHYKFNKLFDLFANTNPGDGVDPKTAFKNGTNIIPLFGVYSPDTGQPYTKDYYLFDPQLSSSSTPNELELDLFNLYPDNINPSGGQNRISKSNVAWYKYQMMPGTIATTSIYPFYTANNILFSSDPTVNCNKATFDYSGPNENGIQYTWDFGDGSDPVTGTTSSTNQLVSTTDRIHYYQASDNYDVSLRLDYPSGCSYTYEKSINIQIGPLPTLTFTNIVGVSDCDASNGSAKVTISSGTISTCTWTNIGGEIINSTISGISSTASNLNIDTYFVTVTTANGCEISGSVGIPNNMAVSVANGFAINTNTLWNTPKNLKGVVKINNGATLTIDGTTVEFAYDVIAGNDEGDELVGARFQVEDGATLIIKNGALLTSCGAGVWDGVETRGTNAKVIINTGATIENAKIAIVNNKRMNIGLTQNMGTIEADHAIFKNNKYGVEVIDGNGSTYFKDCDFIFDYSTRFLYPIAYNCCEYSHKEMNFVHLRESSSNANGNGVKFQGNNFTSYFSPSDIHRGRGIHSENASYSLCNLTGIGDGNNTFSGLGRGIYIDAATSLDLVRIEGNTFDRVMHSITAFGAKNTLITNNHFINLSPSNANMPQFAGITFWGSSGFSISGNDFSGAGNQIDGSNGISIANSSNQGGVCLNNRFKTLDYAIHTQENNSVLKIGCNKFSEDGIDHRVSALYVSYGILGNQGHSDCSNNPTKAAGNVWLGPNTNLGSSIASFASTSYNYYANPAIISPQSTLTNPELTSINDFSNNLTYSVDCQNANSFDVNNCSISWLPPIVPNNFESAVDVLNSIEIYNGILISHKEKYRDLYKKQMELIASIEEMFGSIDNADSDWLQQLSALEEQMKFEMNEIEWNSSEIQLLENELIRAYIFFEKFNQLEELLYQSNTAESYKILASYYFDINEYEKCREILTYINDKTREECTYLSEIKAKYKTAENERFVQFFNLLVDLKIDGKTILNANEEQLALLQEIIDDQVQVSIKAEFEMSKSTHKECEHSIMKINEVHKKKIEAVFDQGSSKYSTFSLFPNPAADQLTFKYELDENSKVNIIEIFDIFGNIQTSFSIDSKSNSSVYDSGFLTNGVFTCILKSDGRVIYSKKLVILK